MKAINLLKLFSVLMIISGSGCKKTVQVAPPVTQVDGEVAYSTDANATAVLTGLYIAMGKSNGIFTNTSSITIFTGLSSDELVTYPGLNAGLLLAYQNALSSLPTSRGLPIMWSFLYNYVYTTNSAIDGITMSTSLSNVVKQQLLGEAKFLRALYYFYLVNLYGDVPIITTTNYSLNSQIGRSSKSQVYQQIIMDLKDAQGLLSTNFLTSDLKTASSERTRPTKWAATALLARVYLYANNFSDAEVQATTLINNTSQFNLVDSSRVFLKNNLEAIWQLQPVMTGYNTYDAVAFVLTRAPNGAQPTSLSSQMMSSFEPGDMRRNNWVGSIKVGAQIYYFPYKYKNYLFNASNPSPTEYLTMFRLSEQYLIRAEAKTQQGETDAVDDLNIVRNRAGLKGYSGGTDKNSLLSAILHERKVEFFAEMGNRWFDLKRTGSVDSVMSVVTPAKGGNWNSNWALYPISQSEILLDPAINQNPGYQ